MRFIKLFLATALAVMLVTFSVSNRELVTIDLFPFGWVLELPLFMVLFIGLITGVMLEYVVVIKEKVKGFNRRREKTKEVRALENEIAALKSAQNITSESHAVVVKK